MLLCFSPDIGHDLASQSDIHQGDNLQIVKQCLKKLKGIEWKPRSQTTEYKSITIPLVVLCIQNNTDSFKDNKNACIRCLTYKTKGQRIWLLSQKTIKTKNVVRRKS